MHDKTVPDVMHDILKDEKQEAIEERNMEIANDMIKERLPTNIISKISELDLNSVKKLQLGK